MGWIAVEGPSEGAMRGSGPRRLARRIAQVALAMAVCWTLWGCGGVSESGSEGQAAQVIAVINGEELPATQIIDYVERARSKVGSDTNAAWEAYLADIGFDSPDAYLEYLVRFYGTEMAVSQKCDELGIAVDPSEVERRIEVLKAELGVEGDDDPLWQSYLAQQGYTEQSIRATTGYRLREQKLYESEVEKVEVDDSFVQDYADYYADNYVSTRGSAIGMKILHSSRALRLLEELKADSSLDFATAFEVNNEYDELSAAKGDLGWDILGGYSSACKEALNGLSAGQYADDLVWTDECVLVLRASEIYDAHKDEAGHVVLGDMPAEIYAQLYDDAKAFAYQEKCDEYVKALYENADVKVCVERFYDLEGQDRS